MICECTLPDKFGHTEVCPLYARTEPVPATNTDVCHVPGIGYFPTAEQTAEQNRQAKAYTELINHGQKTRKLLYSICYLHGPPVVGQRKMEFLYCHAEDEGEARLTYLRSPAAKGLVNLTIVAIAPVIGYHVKDEHGEKLAV